MAIILARKTVIYSESVARELTIGKLCGGKAPRTFLEGFLIRKD